MKLTSIPFVILIVLLIGMFLTACGSGSAGASAAVVPQVGNQPLVVPEDISSSEEKPPQETSKRFWGEEVPRVDEQGAVEIVITPVNLNDPGEMLDFQVSMNTHSVDLSMDLATLATLETDTGHVVEAALWDAPRGGHHVQGTLSFPASVDGVTVLDGVEALTLTLVNVDAPERNFVWER